MKKKFYLYITSLLLSLFTISCIDDTLNMDCSNSDLTVKLQLGIPGTMEEGESRATTSGVPQESQIDDVQILVFSQDKFAYKVENPVLKTVGTTKIVEAALNQSATPVTLMLLTNLNGVENKEQLLTVLSQLKPSDTKQQVYQKLKYTFTKPWDANSILIPMWGECSITPSGAASVSASIDLYRAIAKIAVTVNNGQSLPDDVFQLKSVHVYHARQGGFLAPFTAPNADKEITQVSNPSAFVQFEKADKLEYLASTAEKYSLQNKIYIPEANNVEPGADPATYLVIGGDYKGQFGYYRVDFKEGNVSEGAAYDAIRNYCYQFNIKSVSRPGTTDPDEAVVGLNVDIIRWNEVPMNGIGNQYTLTTDNSGYVLTYSNTVGSELNLSTTYYNGWKVVDQVGDWFTVNIVEQDLSTGKLLIKPKGENMGIRRYGSFYILSGNLKKRITIRQDERSTANCYIAADPNVAYDMIVTIKGNGSAGIYPEGMNGSLIESSEVGLQTSKVAILWETGQGLVTLVGADNNGFSIPNADGVIQYKVNPAAKINNQQAYGMQGGNALIGAFDKNGKLIWSWHIWVCADYSNGGIESFDQKWVNGYWFNDRNLGAISSSPGVASLGLLYQWGRKDPFIGVGEIKKGTTLKIATKNYTVNSVAYNWKNGTTSNNIPYGINNPTSLMPQGLSTAASVGEFLWGTNAGFVSGETNMGVKTIYDPCPSGYRVPPVDAYVFSTNGYSSLTDNYDYNMIFWPNNVYQSGYYYQEARYVEDKYTDSYGFWLNYNSHSTKPSGVPTFTWKNQDKYNPGTPSYQANAKTVAGAAWFPISAVYDGSLSSFSDVDGHSSLTVNSVIWTNSPMDARNNIRRPGGLFLHGTEYTAQQNGRHWHRMNEGNENPDLAAKPRFAAGVRCIRDVKKDFGSANSITAEIELDAKKGATAEGRLFSFNDKWEVIDPGAMWFYMTPDEGKADGKAQPLTFVATEDNKTSMSRTAYLKVRFENGVVGTVKVTQLQEGGVVFTPSYLEISMDGDNNGVEVKANKDIKDAILKTSDSSWLSAISPWYDNSVFYIRVGYNTTNKVRTGYVYVNFIDGTSASYKVIQRNTK